MAFTTLPTYSTGDVVTAANWNTHIKDNFAAMPPDIFTATGELFVGEGADTGGVLSPTSSTDLLVAASGETLGVKYSDTFTINSKFTWAGYTNTAYDGDDTFGGGSNSITITDSGGFDVPSGAAMLLATLRVAWNAGSTDDYVFITNTTDTTMEMLRIDWHPGASTYWLSQTGFIVPASDNILLEITDSSDVNIDLKFFGYVLS